MEIKRSAFTSIDSAKDVTEPEKPQETASSSSSGIADVSDTLEKSAVSTFDALHFGLDTADNWTDFNQHDPGITLLETLAYSLDQLSNYQDIIADEGSLETADPAPSSEIDESIHTRLRESILTTLLSSKRETSDDDD